MSRIACLLQRRATSFSRPSSSRSSSGSSRWTPTRNVGWLEGGSAAAVAAAIGATGMLVLANGEVGWSAEYRQSVIPTQCEQYEDDEDDYDTGYTEADRFFHSLEYHRSLLPDYERRWLRACGVHEIPTKRQRERWPKHVPKASEIPALELDFKFCQKSLEFQDDIKKCQDLQFKIASFLIRQDDEDDQRKGFKMLKELAESSHPDGMCLYGKLNR